MFAIILITLVVAYIAANAFVLLLALAIEEIITFRSDYRAAKISGLPLV